MFWKYIKTALRPNISNLDIDKRADVKSEKIAKEEVCGKFFPRVFVIESDWHCTNNEFFH